MTSVFDRYNAQVEEERASMKSNFDHFATWVSEMARVHLPRAYGHVARDVARIVDSQMTHSESKIELKLESYDDIDMDVLVSLIPYMVNPIQCTCGAHGPPGNHPIDNVLIVCKTLGGANAIASAIDLSSDEAVLIQKKILSRDMMSAEPFQTIVYADGAGTSARDKFAECSVFSVDTLRAANFCESASHPFDLVIHCGTLAEFTDAEQLRIACDNGLTVSIV
jgi:hypothetical protein